jgi:putative ABC transport system permease protein
VALGEPRLTTRVVVFVFVLTTATALCCAVPVWMAARSRSLARHERIVGAEPVVLSRLRGSLIAGQAMVSMVLLIGAVFLGRSYANLWSQGTGLADETYVVSVSYGTRNSGTLADTVEKTTRRLQAVSGVTAVAAGSSLGAILDGYDGGGGQRVSAGGQDVLLMPSQILGPYFEVTGMQMLAGRALSVDDRGCERVVVNDGFAARFWPGKALVDVVGASIACNGRAGVVVGVVRGARDRGLDRSVPLHVYKALETVPLGRANYALRLLPGSAAGPAIKRAVLAEEQGAVIEDISSVSDRLASGVKERAFAALTFVLFAIAGAGVTVTGMFGLVSFITARRRQEVAIRLSLGASHRHVLWVVVRGAVIAATVGTSVGLGLGLLLTRALASRLYGVQPDDPALFVAALSGLIVLIAFAAWLPTRRALELQPSVLLRT